MSGAALAGLVTAIAALIGAVTGLVTALRAHAKINAHTNGGQVSHTVPSQRPPAGR